MVSKAQPRSGIARHRRRGRALALGIAFTLTVGGSIGAGAVLSAGSANAAAPDYGPGIDMPGILGYGSLPLRILTLADGRKATCIEVGVPASSTPGGTEETFNDAGFAFLQSKYIDTGDDNFAAGLAWIGHALFDSTSWVQAKWNIDLPIYDGYPEFRAAVKTMQAEMSSLAGPYTVGVDMVPNADFLAGSAESLVLLSASGNAVPGYELDYTIHGEAAWDTNGAQTASVTSSTDPQTLTYTSTGYTEEGWIEGFAPAAPATSSTAIRDPQNQDLVVFSGTSTATGASEVHPFVNSFPVELTSNIDKATRLPDDNSAVIDTFHIKAADGRRWIKVSNVPVDVTVRYQVLWTTVQGTQQDDVPASTEVVSSGTFVAAGEGDYTQEVVPAAKVAELKAAGKRGFLSVQAQALTADNSTWLSKDFSSPFWDLTETTVIQQRGAIDSQMHDYSIDATAHTTDTITVSGLPADMGSFKGLPGFPADPDTITVNTHLLGATTDNPVCTASNIVQTRTIPARNGVYTVPINETHTKLAPGWYGDQEILADSARVEGITTECGKFTQLFHVGENGVVSVPDMVSEATAFAPDGSQATDKVILINIDPTKDNQLGWDRVYQPEGTDLANATIIDHVAPVSIPGSGIYTNTATVGLADHGLATDQKAYVHWVPYLLVDGVEVKREAIDTPSQMTTILPTLKVKTQAKAGSALPVAGDEIWDTWAVTQGTPEPGDQIISKLYSWPKGSAPVCTGTPLATVTEPITAMTGELPPYKTDASATVPMDYGYIHQPVDEKFNPKDEWSECGLGSETITVNVTPVAPSPAPLLADTGATSLPLAFGGFAALMLGAVSLGVVLLRRRQIATR